MMRAPAILQEYKEALSLCAAARENSLFLRLCRMADGRNNIRTLTGGISNESS